MTDEKEKSQLVDIEGLRAFLNKTDERYVKIGEGTGVIYSLSKNDSGEIILTGSDNSVTKVTDANTTYTFTQKGTVLTITPSTGDPVTINMGEEITSEKIIEALGFTPVQQSDIPDPITESDVSSWGFTKNTGDYTKPSTGIPSTDLAKSVQDSLGLANTALQSFTEKDPTVPSHVKGIKESDITSWNSKVDSVSGKGLSTNDFTNSYKSAIDNLPTSYAPVDAQKNVIEAIKVNNTALTPTDKAVDITVPTKASDIGAMANTVTHLSGDVPTSRKVNGKALTSDITLTATDIGALPNSTDLSVYSLATEAGYDLGLSIDSKTYIMTLELKNKAGTVISTKTLDFPIESMVVNATYASGKITLTLQSGQTLDVDITALVSGLVNDSFTIAGIDMKDNITAAELKTALGIPASYAPTNAQANVIETIKVNNTALTPSSKAVNITVPTKASDIGALPDTTAIPSALSDLTSDATHRTVTDTEKSTWGGKQSALTDTQMNAVNSGITSTKVNTYDGYSSTISAKYTKPSTGIPKTDLASAVQTSLGKADTALQSHQDISGKENSSNKVTSWSTTTTDTHYPSEKLVKTALDGKANSSHGNHVPTTQTANNAVFLRNDNTWQTVTPANIGAAASSHGTHVSYGTSASAVGSTASAGSATTVSRSDHTHSLSKDAVTTALGYTPPTTNTTYSTATTSANGLMSSADKSKLDGIASGATANAGTITGIKMNGSSKGTSGVVDLGTVITSHQDISGKIDKTSAGLSAAINLLNTGDSTPVDNDYFISQYVNGGTTTTSYHRRPISTLWSYIKGKIGVSKGSATQPVYIDANGAIQACTYTLGKSVPSDAKFTDTTYSALTESEVTTLFNGIFK